MLYSCWYCFHLKLYNMYSFRLKLYMLYSFTWKLYTLYSFRYSFQQTIPKTILSNFGLHLPIILFIRSHDPYMLDRCSVRTLPDDSKRLGNNREVNSICTLTHHTDAHGQGLEQPDPPGYYGSNWGNTWACSSPTPTTLLTKVHQKPGMAIG